MLETKSDNESSIRNKVCYLIDFGIESGGNGLIRMVESFWESNLI